MQDAAVSLDAKTARKGLLGILIAAVGQGTIPLYWILLRDVPAEAAICYRAVFGLIFMLFFLLAARLRKEFLHDLTEKRNWIYIGLAGTVNYFVWFLLVWGAQNGFVLDLGFGQFVQPLFCALMGMVIFKQKLSWMKSAALGIVFLGVALMFFIYGALPWLALLVGFFSAYYLVLRKQGPAGCVSGLIFENFFNSLIAVPMLLWLGGTSLAPITECRADLLILLFGAGAVTSITQIIFVYGVQRSTMVTMGFSGYLSPIITVFVGIVFCGEVLTTEKAVGFSCIFFALVLFLADTMKTVKQLKTVASN